MWATGCGKSLPALKSIHNKQTLIVLSQLLHENNWRKEAIKWNIDLSTVTFVCYNSLIKHKDTDWDLIILDEGHRWIDNWTETLPQFNSKELIVLSGTLSSDAVKKMYNIGKPQIDVITTEMAVEWGLLPEPQIKIFQLVLDNIKVNQVFEKGKAKHKKTESCTYQEWLNKWIRVKGDKRPNLQISCTAYQYHQLLVNDIDWAKDKAIKTKDENLWRRVKMLGNQRKSWLASIKTQLVRELIKKLHGKRVVVFANDILQAEMFDVNAVHSKNKRGQLIIEEFNTYKRDLLVSVRQLQESMNLVEPEVGIIVQLNNSKESGKKQVSIKNQQSLGRILRHVSPTLYLFVFKNTQDEVYLNKFMESINPDWFTYITLNDI